MKWQMVPVTKTQGSKLFIANLIIIIIVAIILLVFLAYTQLHLADQSYKIKNYNALWNQSLADLRSGNSTINQYCINRVHDLDLCNQFKSLDYFN
jgi:cell division protein FtsL